MPSDSVVIRLRMLGAAIVRRDSQSVSRDLRGIGGAADSAQAKLAGIGRGALQGAAIAATGVGLIGGAVARIGGQYNAMRDSQEVAFTTFLGSQKKAIAFMGQLQQLALDSPVLSPEDTGNAARALMAYGIGAKQSLPFVKALGDMSAASGRSIAEVMPNAARAIGQIASKGKLQTEELNQLAESVGLNRNRIAKELGMTRDDFAATFTPGNNLSSEKALPAILAAMTTQAGGAAERLSKTTAGRVARAQEAMKIAAGQFTRPFYNALGGLAGGAADRLMKLGKSGAIRRAARGIATGIRSAITGAGAGAKGQDLGSMGGFDVMGIANRVGLAARGIVGFIRGIAPKVVGVVKEILGAFAPMAPFLQNVLLPLFKGIALGVLGSVVGAFKVAIPVIRVIATALGWIGQKAAPVKGVIQGIGGVIGFVFAGPILKAIGLLGKLSGVLGLVGRAARLMRVPISVVGGVMRGAFAIVGRLAGAFVRVHLAVLRFAGTLGGALRRGVVAAGNFVGSVISKIEGIIGRIRGLAGKFVGAGKSVIQSIGRGLRTALGAGFGFAGDLAKGVANAVIGLLNTAIPNKLPLPGPAPDINLPDNPIPKFARGGVVRSPMQLVGERGPELARLPAGTRIYPNAQTRRMLATPYARSSDAPAPARAARLVLTDQAGRILARAVAGHEAHQEALA